MSLSRSFVAVLAAFATVAASAILPGCGSATTGAAGVELRGEYDATGPGPLLAITFYDATTYSVKWNRVCANEAYCTDWGTYATNDANGTVALTSATTGETEELPFAVLETEPLSAMALERLNVLGDVSLGGSQGTLTNGGSTLASDSPSVATSVQVGGQHASLMHPSTSSSQGGGNQKIAYSYFIAKGLKNYQSAGIVGNLIQESGVVPTSAQLGGGPGRGIAQWSVNDRWNGTKGDNLFQFAMSNDGGASPQALTTQLDFIWWELTNIPRYGFAQLKATGNVTDATTVFMSKYEICGKCASSQRIKYAQQALASFGNGDPTVLSMSTSPLSGGAVPLSGDAGAASLSGSPSSSSPGSSDPGGVGASDPTAGRSPSGGSSPGGGTSLGGGSSPSVSLTGGSGDPASGTDAGSGGTVDVCGTGNDNQQAANAAFASYNPIEAVTFAEENWSNGGAGTLAGLQFVEAAVDVTGVAMNVQNGPDLVSFLSGVPFDELSPGNTSITASPGDIVIYSNDTGLDFCAPNNMAPSNCGPFGIIVTGGDASSATADFHIPAKHDVSLDSMITGATVSPSATGSSTIRVYHVSSLGCD